MNQPRKLSRALELHCSFSSRWKSTYAALLFLASSELQLWGSKAFLFWCLIVLLFSLFSVSNHTKVLIDVCIHKCDIFNFYNDYI